MLDCGRADYIQCNLLPFLTEAWARRDGMKQEEKARLHFDDFVDKRVSGDIMDGSDDVFEAETGRFVNDLRPHMLKVTTA